jgi:hypothetical protein
MVENFSIGLLTPGLNGKKTMQISLCEKLSGEISESPV